MTSSNQNIFRITGSTRHSTHKSQQRGSDIFFDPRLNKRLSKQSIRRWFETPLRSLVRHNNALTHNVVYYDVYDVSLWSVF